MPSMPNLDLDVGVPMSVSQAANRVRKGVPDISARLVIGVVTAVIGGPFVLFAAYLLYVVNNVV